MSAWSRDRSVVRLRRHGWLDPSLRRRLAVRCHLTRDQSRRGRQVPIFLGGLRSIVRYHGAGRVAGCLPCSVRQDRGQLAAPGPSQEQVAEVWAGWCESGIIRSSGVARTFEGKCTLQVKAE